MVDGKVAAATAIDDRRLAERADWLAAAKTVTTGAGDRAVASELIDQEVKPFVDNDIRSDWLAAMRTTTASVAASYDAATAGLAAGAGGGIPGAGRSGAGLVAAVEQRGPGARRTRPGRRRGRDVSGGRGERTARRIERAGSHGSCARGSAPAAATRDADARAVARTRSRRTRDGARSVSRAGTWRSGRRTARLRGRSCRAGTTACRCTRRPAEPGRRYSAGSARDRRPPSRTNRRRTRGRRGRRALTTTNPTRRRSTPTGRTRRSSRPASAIPMERIPARRRVRRANPPMRRCPPSRRRHRPSRHQHPHRFPRLAEPPAPPTPAVANETPCEIAADELPQVGQ